MNLNKLMKQAQKMQEQMAKTQSELEDKTVEVKAAGGKVAVVANGAGDVLSIKMGASVCPVSECNQTNEGQSFLLGRGHCAPCLLIRAVRALPNR